MSDITTLMMAAAGGAAEETDANFKQTVLLLHGDGTNGAQNNTFLDSSTNNFTITRNGNTTQGTFSPFSTQAGGWSNYFDGSGDYLSISDSTAFNMGSGDFTAECWIYTTNASATAAFITTAETTDHQGFFLGMYGGGFTFLADDNGANPWAVDIYGGTVVANTWTHVAGVRNGNVFTLYVNGVSIGSSTQSITLGNSNNKIVVGGRTASSGQYLPGYLSNARVVKGTAVYTSAFTPSTSSLTAISGTELLTCQSNRFVDNSSNAFAITRNGDVKVTPFSPFAPTAAYSASVNGGSGYFDGSGDYLTLTDASNDLDLGGVQASVDFWAYVPDSTVQYNAIQKGNSNSYNLTDGFSYSVAQVSSTWALFYNNAGSGASITGTAPAANQWTHICAATDTSNNIALFINGTRVATASNAISKPTTRTGIKIGEALSNAGDWSGYMSGLRFLTGANAYDPTDTTITIPTAPPTAVSGTELLLNFTNAGIFDNTGKNNLETVGNAQIDTTTKKFGTGALEFDGTGDALFIPSNENFQLTGDFTIEMWFRADSLSTSGLLSNGETLFQNDAFALILGHPSYVNKLSVWARNVSSAPFLESGTLSTGIFYHLAITRSGSNLYLFLDGTQVDTASSTATIGLNTLGTNIGKYWNGDFDGYIDDLRITKGVARYTSNFTAPTKAFPDL